MIIGILEVDIRLFCCNSLKDKRRILKSLISRIRNNFNVSVTSYSSKVLDKILEFLKKEREIFIIDCKKEIF